MPNTVFHRIGSSLPKSSDLNEEVWAGEEPSDLLRDGYATSVDFYKQAQRAHEADTTSQDQSHATLRTPTSIASQDSMVIQLRTPEPRRELRNWVTMHALQEWEGHVLHKGAKEFTARLRDVTAEGVRADPGATAEEEATIPLSELADADLTRIQPGTVFRWVIGYQRAASGTKKRMSEIVLRDLPSITDQDTAQGSKWAERVMRLFQE